MSKIFHNKRFYRYHRVPRVQVSLRRLFDLWIYKKKCLRPQINMYDISLLLVIEFGKSLKIAKWYHPVQNGRFSKNKRFYQSNFRLVNFKNHFWAFKFVRKRDQNEPTRHTIKLESNKLCNIPSPIHYRSNSLRTWTRTRQLFPSRTLRDQPSYGT